MARVGIAAAVKTAVANCRGTGVTGSIICQGHSVIDVAAESLIHVARIASYRHTVGRRSIQVGTVG